MRIFEARNTNLMAPNVYRAILKEGIVEHSRNGRVLAFSEPCAFVYTHPSEMVNVDTVRDCNPFFHLMEAAAMVADHNSVEFLSYFCSNMGQYSDDGKTYNAFYGTRMGSQFNQVATLLHKDPDTRQAVIQLWDKRDILKDTKDKACNMSMVFRAHQGILDMTVFCRSNDLIYGGVSGANVVHFPFIHAVLCFELGYVQGKFNHVVNNAHVYVDNPHINHLLDIKAWDVSDDYMVEIDCDRISIAYFVAVASRFPTRIGSMVGAGQYINSVLIPMYNAFAEHKRSNNGLDFCLEIRDNCWQKAAIQWLERREK